MNRKTHQLFLLKLYNQNRPGFVEYVTTTCWCVYSGSQRISQCSHVWQLVVRFWLSFVARVYDCNDRNTNSIVIIIIIDITTRECDVVDIGLIRSVAYCVCHREPYILFSRECVSYEIKKAYLRPTFRHKALQNSAGLKRSNSKPQSQHIIHSKSIKVVDSYSSGISVNS